MMFNHQMAPGGDIIMTSFPVICTFAIVKMASSENSSMADIVRTHGFKVSQIIATSRSCNVKCIRYSFSFVHI